MKTISTLNMKLRNHLRWVVGTLILTVTAGAWLGFNQLVPTVPGGLRSGQSRLAWYLRSGQWHADARTAVAAAGYFLNPSNEVPATDNFSTNNQVADAYLPPLPTFGAPRTNESRRS